MYGSLGDGPPVSGRPDPRRAPDPQGVPKCFAAPGPLGCGATVCRILLFFVQRLTWTAAGRAAARRRCRPDLLTETAGPAL